MTIQFEFAAVYSGHAESVDCHCYRTHELRVNKDPDGVIVSCQGR